MGSAVHKPSGLTDKDPDDLRTCLSALNSGHHLGLSRHPIIVRSMRNWRPSSR